MFSITLPMPRQMTANVQVLILFDDPWWWDAIRMWAVPRGWQPNENDPAWRLTISWKDSGSASFIRTTQTVLNAIPRQVKLHPSCRKSLSTWLSVLARDPDSILKRPVWSVPVDWLIRVHCLNYLNPLTRIRMYMIVLLLCSPEWRRRWISIISTPLCQSGRLLLSFVLVKFIMSPVSLRLIEHERFQFANRYRNTKLG